MNNNLLQNAKNLVPNTTTTYNQSSYNNDNNLLTRQDDYSIKCISKYNLSVGEK